MSVSAIAVENVSKHWTTPAGQVRAVDAMSFELGAGHVQRPAGTVGLRQVDDAAPDRRARDRRRRPRHHRRARRHRAAARAAQHRDGVPELRAVSASHRRREHPVRPARAARFRRRLPDAPRACRGPAGIGAAARAEAVAALGRAAAARRAGPRDHQRGAGVPDGRAAVEPRCAVARRNAAGDPRAAARARHHDGVRHARPGRGDVDGRPRDPAATRAGSSRTARRSNSTSSRRTRSSRGSSARRR